MNEFFDGNEIIVTAIGLYQIFSGQFQKTYKPRHYLCCGQAGPLGWEVPACIGVKLGRPEDLVVGEPAAGQPADRSPERTRFYGPLRGRR
jgi:tartronate-semialdehyde synthase